MSLQLNIRGTFSTNYCQLPFSSENVGGEIRGEASLSLLWKTDSSVDLRYDIRLYEGETPFTDELNGEEEVS